MSYLAYLFSFLCSQDASRSFLVAGHALPMCQRCTGLYMGMALGFIYVLLRPQHRRNFAPRWIVCVNILCLLVMPVFGFHLLDPGPAWRLWTGLIYGNAIILLLVPAAWILCTGGKERAGDSGPASVSFVLFFVLLNSIPLWLPLRSTWFLYCVLVLATVGAICTAACIAAVVFCAICQVIWKGVRHVDAPEA